MRDLEFGAEIHEFRAQEREDFAVDLDAVATMAARVDARVLFVCSPNNPTGIHLSPEPLDRLARSLPSCLVVIDEAYAQLADEPIDSGWLLGQENVVLLRSLTKDHALAGLRLGYILAHPSVSAAIEHVRPPWNVNAVAQAAGIAALDDHAHLERARAEIRRARGYVSEALTRQGFRILPTATNFVLVEVGDAASVRRRLLRAGVCVRDCTSFGLPEYIRIGLRTLVDCKQLVRSFEQAFVGHDRRVTDDATEEGC